MSSSIKLEHASKSNQNPPATTASLKCSYGKDTHKLIKQVYNLLGSLPWSGNIHGFKNMEPMHHFTIYITHDWLVDMHENQILELLHTAIKHHLPDINVKIESIYFCTRDNFHGYLKSGYEGRKAGEYNQASQVLAANSRRQSSVGFVTNVNGNHWVATVIDFAESQILYGDSLGSHPNQAFTDVLQWWCNYHTGHHFTIGSLDIAKQVDLFSCGLLSVNALAHFFLPNEYLLINVKKVDDERLKVLLEVRSIP
ncbi:hypothetical protein BDR06DRAFT_982202 [Suillus hirtellus]|nr:hypothetical protein BDR06DRAFT_982202 [Suillus hirtellus]